ncbi:peroxide stress protein YaaA [Phenylobacterium sp. J367]|uniref:peroxide stress protein YaaA n=1 Tax=Phenylobacterium sp. J367 TaxID=2898435 RepID=UPI00215135ED|nr:peroxide stress protein YaaA [Phenylobacterium sp. J367]MCR5877441.1 peroxide stress protein YaaA [Phenylobacterium sp. J367]
MLIVLSPAKALDFSAGPDFAPLTAPQLADQTAELSKTTKKLRAADLKTMMALSDNLAKLNRERFQAFDPASEDGLQAAFAFNGDVYTGLKARTLDRKGLAWAQDHVRILSGLYGLLRPMDAIQPYRLEMGVRIKTKRGQSLYDFWGSRISEALNEEARGHKDKTLVNCASGEYFGAVDRAALTLPVVTCRFLEEKDGESRIISFYAKRARGLLARYAIDNRIAKRDDLKAFDVDGYRFVPSQSSDEEFTFSRPQPPPPSAAKKA